MVEQNILHDGSWFENIIFSFMPDPAIELNGTPKEMTNAASWKAFTLSTIAGIPPGPFGLATIVPELIALTKLQVNLIYRIAKYYGKEEKLTPTLMIHVFATGFGIALGRTVLRKVGTRVIIKALSTQAIRKVAQQIGVKIGARVVQRLGARWLPFVTAPIFGAFSKSQTTRIGNAAIEIFSQDIELEKTISCSNGHEIPFDSKFCPECGEKMN